MYDDQHSDPTIFSDDCDVASDIEADLQGLSVKTDSRSHIAFSDANSLRSFSSALAGSLLSVIEIAGDYPHSDEQRNYLRSNSLKGVFTTLLNLQLKENSGSPSCISYQGFIVVGTNNGFIFVFDRFQKLRLFINTAATDVGCGQGPITFMSQNLSSTRLLTGFASGRVAMWQLPSEGDGSPAADNTEEDNDVPSESFNSLIRKSASPLRIVDDAHQDGQSVIVCAFTCLPTVAVSVDSGGSVFEMDFRRGILGRSTRSTCFFSGSHGEICAISPLRPTRTSGLLKSLQCHSSFRALYGSAVVAIASFTKVIVVALKPKFRVVFWQYLKGHPSTLPLLAWFWSQPEVVGEGSHCSAVLGFARSSSIHIARFTTRSTPSAPTAGDDSADVGGSAGTEFTFGGKHFVHRLEVLRVISLDFRLESLHFLSVDYLTVLDSEEVLRLIDLSTSQEVESYNLSATQICYNSSAFKALAIGGTVSEALTCASERACAASILSVAGTLLLLGKSGISLFSLKSWKEIALGLVKVRRVEEGLVCCRSALRCGPMTPHMRDSLLDVLHQMPLTNADSQQLNLGFISTLVELCDFADLIPFLESTVVPALREDAVAFPILLGCITDRLMRLKPLYEVPPNDSSSIRSLAPDLAMDVLTWCLQGPGFPPRASTSSLFSEGHTERQASQPPGLVNGRQLCEACVVRLTPASLDIDKVLKFCLANGLFESFVYIHCHVLKDHETAFRWLTDLLLKKAAHMGRSTGPLDVSEHCNVLEAVNVIILFLRSCFVGEEVCGIAIEKHLQEDVFNKIFNLLLSSHISSPDQRQSSVLSPPTLQSVCIAPRLWALLHFGATIDLVNMLTLVLRESSFFAIQPSSAAFCLGMQRRQRLLNGLTMCAARDIDESFLPLGGGDITHILCFVGEQILLPENESLVFDGQKIFAMLRRLAALDESANRDRMQLLAPSALCDVLLRLLTASLLPASSELFKLAEAAGLYDFCEQVYRRQGNVVAVLSCLLSNLTRLSSTRQPLRNSIQLDDLVTRIFTFLVGCLSSHTATGSRFAHLVNRFLQDVETYATLNPMQCLIILMLGVGPTMRRVLVALDTVFMTNEALPPCFLSQESRPQPSDSRIVLSVDGPHHPAAAVILKAFYQLKNSDSLEADRENALSAVVSAVNLRLGLDELVSHPDPLVAEFYIQLLLTHEQREDLGAFLMVNNEYRASVVFDLLDEKKYPFELACVYEKIGNTEKAFNLLREDFLACWNGLVDCCRDRAGGSSDRRQVMAVHRRAESWFAIAARQCTNKNTPENESPWFDIIGVLSTLRKHQLCDELAAELNLIFQNLLKSASPYVPMPSLMRCVFQLADTSTVSFDSTTYRFLLQLVEAWHKEVQLQRDCHRLMMRDTTTAEARLTRLLKRGIGLRRYLCSLCGLTFARRHRQHRSLVTCQLHTGGFCTLDERLPNRPEMLIFWCGHGVDLDCYTMLKRQHALELEANTTQYFCLQCSGKISHIFQSRGGPPLSLKVQPDRGEIATPRPFPLLGAYDEIRVGPLHAMSDGPQNSRNPFGDDDD